MNDRVLRLYHRLPSAPQSIAASLWGFYLRSWRYGSETERLVEEALARERWSVERWRAFQDERLASLLHKAATEVPFYRDQWNERRQRGDRASWDRLENWPILEKAPLRAAPTAFLADSSNPRAMYAEHTSGTSGTPVTLYWSRRTVREWYALCEARCRRWHGVSRHDRWAILGGQLVVPVARTKPPFWIWNAGLKQLYLSSYHLAPDLIASYLDALARYKITYILGYSSALHALAHGALRLGRRDVRLKVAITNAEPLFAHQRQVIGDAFGCPVRENYGMAELVANATECEHGRMHVWPEIGLVEVTDGDRPVARGDSGDLVCTGLFNQDMPLIRYRIGDRGAFASDSVCGCQRRLPVFASIEGRSDDVLYTRDGRRVGRLDPVFKADLPVIEAQIVQESLDRVRVRYVPAAAFDAASSRAISERLRDRMGDVEVVMEPVDRIARTANGKMRAVICNLPPDQRRQLHVA